MSSSTQLDTTTVVLLLLGALLVLPLLTMGMGFGGMVGYGGMMGYGMMDGTGSGWWPLLGMAFPLLFLAVLIGGGYVLFTRASEGRDTRDSAMAELRMAYARGDLSDEEFERRRERLERPD